MTVRFVSTQHRSPEHQVLILPQPPTQTGTCAGVGAAGMARGDAELGKERWEDNVHPHIHVCI